MLARIISTLALWAIAILVVVFFGGGGWIFLLAVLAGGALWETCRLLEKIGMNPLYRTAQAASALIFAATWAFPKLGINAIDGGSLAFACASALLSVLILMRPHGNFAEKSVIPTAAALLAVPFMLHWLAVPCVCVKFEMFESAGLALSLWILAAAKFSDVGAYVIGAAFGRRKMSPDISPNKTWEGAIGGIFSSSAVSAAIAWGCSPIMPNAFTPILAASMGAVIGVSAILSDLLESVLKRRADTKDSGASIPGIGGVLDLADSLLLGAPVGMAMLSIIL